MTRAAPSQSRAQPSRPGSVWRALAVLALLEVVSACRRDEAVRAEATAARTKPALAESAAEAAAASRVQPVAPTALVSLPPGRYRPFYKGATQAESIPVPAFELERAPVSREQFLAFVAKHPKFRKSRVQPLFAEGAYLADWQGDFEPGADRARAPVTFVSWFAARAYCEAHGRRLPTMAEWERAASSEETDTTSAAVAPTPEGVPHQGDAAARFRFAMGGTRSPAHGELAFGEVWEWTSDFNSILVPKGAINAKSGDSSLFCGDGARAVDATDYAGFLRHSFRNSLKANYTLKNLGFRCAKDVP